MLPTTHFVKELLFIIFLKFVDRIVICALPVARAREGRIVLAWNGATFSLLLRSVTRLLCKL